MAARYKALFCGGLIAGIASSNPAEGMVVRLLSLLIDAEVSASVTDHHWFRGVLPGVCFYNPYNGGPRPDFGCCTKQDTD